MIFEQQEEKLKAVAHRLADRFYNNIPKEKHYQEHYDGLYQDVLQSLINAVDITHHSLFNELNIILLEIKGYELGVSTLEPVKWHIKRTMATLISKE